MVMLNNELCLTSVVEFLRRGCVDRGTGGGKVVVVVDSSKRKVLRSYGNPCRLSTRRLRLIVAMSLIAPPPPHVLSMLHRLLSTDTSPPIYLLFASWLLCRRLCLTT